MAKIAVKEVGDNGVKFAFTDGEIVEVNLNALPKDIVHQLALHGLSQKGGDSYSGSDEPGEARGLLLKVIERLEKGEWKAQREGGSGGARVTDLAKALAEITGKPLEEVLERLDEMDKGEKMARRKHPAVAAVLARMAAERASAKASAAEGAETGDLL